MRYQFSYSLDRVFTNRSGNVLDISNFFYKMKKESGMEYLTSIHALSKMVEHRSIIRGEVNKNCNSVTANSVSITEKKSNTDSELIDAIKVNLNQELTKREIEVSSLWLNGYSSKESAKILGIAARTIEEYRAKTKGKLKLRDKKGLYNLVLDKRMLDVYLTLARTLATRTK